MSASDPYRILIPLEYQALLDAIPQERHEILVKLMMNTGARYEEFSAFAEHLSWFDAQNRAISIPKEFSKPYQGLLTKISRLEKIENRTEKENKRLKKYKNEIKSMQGRTIHLTPAFTHELEKYLKRHQEKGLEFPTRDRMNRNLKNWWCLALEGYRNRLEPIPWQTWFPTVKTLRKTWESYLLATGRDYMAVCCNMGHSPQISYNHYANLDPRLKSCMDDVKKLVEGWMT